MSLSTAHVHDRRRQRGKTGRTDFAVSQSTRNRIKPRRGGTEWQVPHSRCLVGAALRYAVDDCHRSQRVRSGSVQTSNREREAGPYGIAFRPGGVVGSRFHYRSGRWSLDFGRSIGCCRKVHLAPHRHTPPSPTRCQVSLPAAPLYQPSAWVTATSTTRSNARSRPRCCSSGPTHERPRRAHAYRGRASHTAPATPRH